MKEERIKNLIEKYKSGESSLKENEFLFDNVDESNPEMKSLSSFIYQHKKSAPNNFNDKLWESFEKRNIKFNRNKKIKVLSIAASVILLVTLYINTIQQNKLSNNEKQALLNEAKNMFTESKKPEIVHHIILESDLIVVYTKSEKISN